MHYNDLQIKFIPSFQLEALQKRTETRKDPFEASTETINHVVQLPRVMEATLSQHSFVNKAA